MPNRYQELERALARKRGPAVQPTGPVGAPAWLPAPRERPTWHPAPRSNGAVPTVAASSLTGGRYGHSFTAAPFRGRRLYSGATSVTVPPEAVARAIRMETSVPYMYLDSKGYVTIGVGHLVTDADAAAALDLRHNTDGEAATDTEKRAEYTTVAGKEKNKVYTYYKQFTALHLTDDVIKALLSQDLETVVAGLRGGLTDYDTYPMKAQEALIDMAFNLGVAGLFKKFPKFIAAVKRRDWATAATESNRPDVGRDRNAEIKTLLEEAVK